MRGPYPGVRYPSYVPPCRGDPVWTSYAPADGSVSEAGDASHSDGGNDAATRPDGGPIVDGGTSCGACNTPPAGGCYGLAGTCQSGHCVYPVVSGASCDDNDPCTVADACNASGQCQGTPLACTTPPAAVCVSASELQTYDTSGVCQSGLCVYQSHQSACSSTCSGGSCQSNPCASITCNMPPSVCYASSGTCDNGSCSYGYANGTTCNDGNACTTMDSCDTGVCQGVPMACESPPASTCKDSQTAQIYAAQGSCAAGACSYTYAYQTCATGCSNGACNASGWTAMTSNTDAELIAVWGSSASAVWAGGFEGTMLFYNGVQWEVRPTGLTAGSAIYAIHGTSASNVFALTSAGLLHFDGTSWSGVSALVPEYVNYPTVFAIGDNDVLLSGETEKDGTNFVGDYTLTRVTNGVATKLATWTGTFFDESQITTAMWAFSATDVYVPGNGVLKYDGSSMTPTPVGIGAPGASHIWAASQQAVFADDGGNVYELGTSGTWAALDPSLPNSSIIYDLTGTAAKHVYAVGGSVDFLNEGGFIDIFDGVGWTSAVLPANTPSLLAAWGASTGQVFAVGAGGTIVEGP